MKHTKGPWRANNMTNNWVVYAQDPYEYLAKVEMNGPAYTSEAIDNCEANARLMAAAPEMYTVLNHLATYARDYLALDDEATAILKDAFVVLTKAEGI